MTIEELTSTVGMLQLEIISLKQRIEMLEVGERIRERKQKQLEQALIDAAVHAELEQQKDGTR